MGCERNGAAGMITIAIANQKGGVGKTSTVANLGYGAALAGKAVLVVDLDSQGNIADSYGMKSGSELCTWLGGDGFYPAMPRPTTLPRLGVIRADKTTVGLKNTLVARGFAEYSIRDSLAEIAGMGIDICLLDCAPSIDVFHTAALVAADWLLVPTR